MLYVGDVVRMKICGEIEETTLVCLLYRLCTSIQSRYTYEWSGSGWSTSRKTYEWSVPALAGARARGSIRV